MTPTYVPALPPHLAVLQRWTQHPPRPLMVVASCRHGLGREEHVQQAATVEAAKQWCAAHSLPHIAVHGLQDTAAVRQAFLRVVEAVVRQQEGSMGSSAAVYQSNPLFDREGTRSSQLEDLELPILMQVATAQPVLIQPGYQAYGHQTLILAWPAALCRASWGLCCSASPLPSLDCWQRHARAQGAMSAVLRCGLCEQQLESKGFGTLSCLGGRGGLFLLCVHLCVSGGALRAVVT